jgi:cyclopropane fatty-acyl-phospholipid synthase-like methyltransferase
LRREFSADIQEAHIHTVKQITKLCTVGKLIEFDCGEGNLPYLLPCKCYYEYMGYDISEVTINRPKQRVVKERIKNINFELCDMTKLKETYSASLILVEENLC